jgi:hypothetical protein
VIRNHRGDGGTPLRLEYEQFRRHGVKPGQRVHVAVVDRNGSETAGEQLPSFFASFDGPADLAERSGEILRSEFPDAR